MMRRLGASATLLLALLVAGAVALAKSEAPAAAPGALEFEGKNAIATAHGSFHRWRFTRVEIDRDHPERSEVEVEVDIESLDTGIGRRDDHLRSDDFFDIEKFPTARVRVHGAVADGAAENGSPRYRARFEITIRDVTKTLDGHFEVVSVTPPEVKGELVLNRIDFGVGSPKSRWNPMSVKNEIPVRFAAKLPLD